MLKGAKTNTQGSLVEGIWISPFGASKKLLTVRFTSDHVGETLSIADDATGTMFVVPFEDVDWLIKKTREARDAKN